MRALRQAPQAAARAAAVARRGPHDAVRAQSASAGASNGAAPSEAAVAKQVVVVAGPTGVGKTRLAVSLAQRLGGEVVSADAVQVYSPLRVGANVDEAAMLAVPHHLVGHVGDLDLPYSVHEFASEARQVLSELHAKGRTPVVVGGSCLYIHALLFGSPPSGPPPSAAARARLMQRAAKLVESFDASASELRAAYGEEAVARLRQLSVRRDAYRVARLLEILETRGELPGAYVLPEFEPGAPQLSRQLRLLEPAGGFDFRCFFVTAPRETLGRITDLRSERMVERGLLSECLRYEASLLTPGNRLARAIGYRQGLEFLTRLRELRAMLTAVQRPSEVASAAGDSSPTRPRGVARLADDPEVRLFFSFLDELQAANRSLQKRQATWFRGEPLFEHVNLAARLSAAELENWTRAGELPQHAFDATLDAMMRVVRLPEAEHRARLASEEFRKLQSELREVVGPTSSMRTYRPRRIVFNALERVAGLLAALRL